MILAAGLSPAWQQILCFDEFHVGEVNRAKSANWCASGKVINVAVANAHLGDPTTLVSCVGGLTGRELAREVEAMGIHADWIEVDQPTRVCTTILQVGGPTTELVENAAPVSETVLQEFSRRVRTHARTAEVVVIAGSLPGNASDDYYRRLIDGAPGKLVLDFRGPGLLQCLPLAPLVVKPNREELEQTVGRPLTSDSDLTQAMQELNRQGAEWMVISDGPRAVWMTSQSAVYKLVPPRVEVVNPIGCGDCMAAGIAGTLHRGGDVLDAVRFGVAAASLNATLLLPGRLTMSEVLRLVESVNITRLS